MASSLLFPLPVPPNVAQKRKRITDLLFNDDAYDAYVRELEYNDLVDGSVSEDLLSAQSADAGAGASEANEEASSSIYEVSKDDADESSADDDDKNYEGDSMDEEESSSSASPPLAQSLHLPSSVDEEDEEEEMPPAKKRRLDVDQVLHSLTKFRVADLVDQPPAVRHAFVDLCAAFEGSKSQ